MKYQEPLNSPGEYLLKNFIIPARMPLEGYAALMKIRRFRLRDFLNGKSVSLAFIFKLSKETFTLPRFWMDLQTTWQFAQFLNKTKRKRCSVIWPIEPIAPSQHHDTIWPGKILLTEFIRPSNTTVSVLAKKLKIYKGGLFDIVNGKIRITPFVAAKLGAAFGTGTKYWLDIETRYDVQQLLKSEVIDPAFSTCLTNFCDSTPSDWSVVKRAAFSLKKDKHPGIILYERYIKPSKITSKDWRRLFCMTREAFNSILHGKKELPLAMILRLSRLFHTKPLFWIDLQNRYYSTNAEKNLSAELKNINGIKQPLPKKGNLSLPINHLVDNFLEPLNWSISDFARWIKVSPGRLYHLIQGETRIDFDLAIRIGEALNMDPMYWIRLQAEHDIMQFESKLQSQN